VGTTRIARWTYTTLVAYSVCGHCKNAGWVVLLLDYEEEADVVRGTAEP